MARWALLTDWLSTAEDRVDLTWPQLEAIVGTLPSSATRHRAWWSGDRPHVGAWTRAGYRVGQLAPGRRVTFVRAGTARPTASSRVPTDIRAYLTDEEKASGDLLLVTCVKSKRATPAAAQDLYTSPLFRRERAYAEATGLNWFILSAEHGLVQPEEWLAPYERYLPDTSSSYQVAWGNFVAERLELLAGKLHGRRIEIHASHDYVEAVRRPIEAKGASLLTPLAGLAHGERLRWYDEHGYETTSGSVARGGQDPHPQTAHFVAALLDPNRAISPSEFLAQSRGALSHPGLYSWWVDRSGAEELSTGLGHTVEPGLVYAGLAGATRWPSGRPSSNTLWSRIAGMHLGGRHEFSTFRRTLGSILATAESLDHIDEARLTVWMNQHLQVIAIPHDDADTLGRLESDVLDQLDPPLNLQRRPRTPLRARLTELRSAYS